jgi:predicted ArsR family transcriptional regulator
MNELPDMHKKAASAKRGRITQMPAVFCIEGEYVTRDQIAERTGLSKGAARERMRKLSEITWAGIRGERVA